MLDESRTLPTLDPSLGIRSVSLAVAELSRSVDFYHRLLGLPLIEREPDSATLGADPAHPLLELTALSDPTAPPRNSTGLFHVAFLHPTRSALADTVLRLTNHRWPIDGASDHGVSEALYLSDPDGLGLELYVDRPREQWRRRADGHGVEMFTMPLDLDDLLAQAPGSTSPSIAPSTVIGHIHLKVSDVERALAFYRDVLGFEEQARLPAAGFVAAGGYHHHIGLNSWHSAGGAPAPTSAPGLRTVEFALDSQRESISLQDPDGNSLSFTPR